jgi:hypothetical protein
VCHAVPLASPAIMQIARWAPARGGVNHSRPQSSAERPATTWCRYSASMLRFRLRRKREYFSGAEACVIGRCPTCQAPAVSSSRILEWSRSCSRTKWSYSIEPCRPQKLRSSTPGSSRRGPGLRAARRRRRSARPRSADSIGRVTAHAFLFSSTVSRSGRRRPLRTCRMEGTYP